MGALKLESREGFLRAGTKHSPYRDIHQKSVIILFTGGINPWFSAFRP